MPTQFDNFRARLGINQPSRRGIGFNYAPFTVQQGQQTPGEKLIDKVAQRKQTGTEIYQQNRSENTNRVAQDVVNKSAFQIPVDEFGLPENKLTNFQNLFENRLKGISKRGDLALATAQAKNQWARMKEMQDLGSYIFTGSAEVEPWEGGNATDIPGADKNNLGAKAVSLAMRAVKNHTPYVWGGNSLTRGIDCSGLVQQVYRQLGINLPRVTYDQAKSGRRVSMNSIRPGDLIFYNTGSRDPNGIGRYGHVAIYMGNGRIVEAANSRAGLRVSAIVNSNGSPALAIRPY